MNTINIKCPVCGAVLTVPLQPGIESKNVTCPVCKNKNPFTAFSEIKAGTEQHSDQGPITVYGGGSQNGDGSNFTLGVLAVAGLEEKFQLKPGINVIGRKAPSSSATVQIPCPAGEKRMSREHIVIEVKKIPGKGFVHVLSLYKEAVNKTFVNHNPLTWGDKIILKHGDTIHLPSATIRFEIPTEKA